LALPDAVTARFQTWRSQHQALPSDLGRSLRPCYQLNPQLPALASFMTACSCSCWPLSSLPVLAAAACLAGLIKHWQS